MVAYKEKTDTCPDCSNIPCHCEIPAGYAPTPTPWTDDGGRYCIHERRERWIKTVPLKTSEELERELTAVTEQRDRLAEAVANLLEVKGRHNTSIAYEQLEKTFQSLNQNAERIHGGVREPKSEPASTPLYGASC